MTEDDIVQLGMARINDVNSRFERAFSQAGLRDPKQSLIDVAHVIEFQLWLWEGDPGYRPIDQLVKKSKRLRKELENPKLNELRDITTKSMSTLTGYLRSITDPSVQSEQIKVAYNCILLGFNLAALNPGMLLNSMLAEQRVTSTRPQIESGNKTASDKTWWHPIARRIWLKNGSPKLTKAERLLLAKISIDEVNKHRPLKRSCVKSLSQVARLKPERSINELIAGHSRTEETLMKAISMENLARRFLKYENGSFEVSDCRQDFLSGH